MSFVESVEKKISSRELKQNILKLLGNGVDDTLLETVISTIAHNAIAERSQKEKAIMAISLNRAALMFAENNSKMENLDKRLDDARGSTKIFTPHPNYSLNKKSRTTVLDIYEALSDNKVWQDVANGRSNDKLKKLVSHLSQNLTKPVRMTVAEEWELTDIDADRMLDAIPEYVVRNQDIRESLIGSTQKQIRIPAEELEQYVGLVEAKSWGLDRDSKPNVTAAVMEEEINNQINRTREGYVARLKLVEQQIREAGFNETANTLKEKIDVFQKNKEITAAQLARELLEIKTQHEGKSDDLPKHKDLEGKDTPFSVLDMAYIQVKTGGECWPKGEIRQNAAMHATAMNYAKTLLPQNLQKAVLNNNYLISALKLNPSEIQKPINKEMDRLNPLIKDYYEARKEKPETKPEDFGLTQQQIDFYETFAGMKVANLYPDAIHSYVIAETGVMDSEKFEREMQREIGRIEDSGIIIPKDTTLEELASGKIISEKVKEDMLAVMFMKLATSGEHPLDKAKADKLEIIPLFESFHSITKGWSSLDLLELNEHYTDYITSCNRNPLPTITDPKTGKSRVMTIADAKRAMGIEDRIKEVDEETPVKASITVMHAGSDAMRENGLGIGPLNTHYQERVQEKLIEQGIWVDIYQGTGAAMHRSHPASPHVARETTQGGARYHASIVQMVMGWCQNMATSICNIIGYTLPKEFHEVLAAYPGHMGNSMMMPKESPEVKKATREWLDAACDKHSGQFDDPAFQHFFETSTAFDYTKMFNFSARPDGRVGVAFALDKVRAIGYSMSLFATGSNNTLIAGMNEFFGMNHDNGYKMTDDHRDEIIGWLKESPKIQEMMTRLTHGIATANMDSAWAFQGVERIIKDGEVYLQKGNVEVRLDDLLDEAKERRSNGEITKENVANYKYADCFGAEALALAEADKEYQTTAKAVYEIYSRMQIELVHQKLLEGTVPWAGTYHADKAKEDKLKALQKELSEPYFDPKKIFEIMTPEMREELKDKMKPIDRARMALANHHNKSKPLDENGLYKAFATCMEGFETGAPACLRHTFINFTNDVVMGKNPKDKGAEFSISA